MIAQVSVGGMLALVLGCGVTLAQSTLPPMAPTLWEKPIHRARVIVDDGQLTVTANNSSLNEILRDIGRRTGIRVKGGVIDEQVFGKYGPARVADVLALLLNDTKSNMLLALNPDNAEFQLVLTPKQGGPTPPNPHPPEVEFVHNDPPAPPPVENEPAVKTDALPEQASVTPPQETNHAADLATGSDTTALSNQNPPSYTTLALNQSLTSTF